MIYAALFDSLIRLTTIAIRGIFVFAAAKYLSTEDFGLYVAISAVIALLQYAVAGDFSYIAHREFFSSRIGFDEILKTQAVLIGFLFIIAIPIELFLLPSGIGRHDILMALFILISEAMTSEIQRHLVAISRFTCANLMLLMKSAGWMFPLLIMFAVDNSYRNLECIINAWMAGLVASLFTGLVWIRSYIFSESKLNKRLLQIYFKRVTIILIGTLATRSLFSIDRIIVEKFIGVEQAGTYGLFVGIAAAFVAILDAGVLTRSYPELVRIGAISRAKHKVLSKKIKYRVIFITGLAILAYAILVASFLSIIKKPEYLDYKVIGFYLILAYGIYSLSFPDNCRLYALGKDKLITAINICSLTPLAVIFYASSLNLNQVAIVVVACSSLHYVLRQLAVGFKVDICAT